MSRRHRSIGVTIGTNEAQTLGSRTEVWIQADYRQEWLERQTREVVPEWLPGHEGEGKSDDGGRDEEFRAPCGGTDASGALLTAGQGLLSGRLPGDVRANIFRALALLPGLVATQRLHVEPGCATLGLQLKSDRGAVVSVDRIERETLIEAPLERVWQLVTEPGFWVASQPSGAAVEGETNVCKNEQYGDFPVRVETVTPQTYVSYRWASAFAGADLSVDNTTLVEFTLAPEGSGTRLRVVESGFAALRGSAELRAKAHEDNSGGWAEVMDAFKKRAEER